MKNWIVFYLTLLLVAFTQCIYAQKNDYVWLSGFMGNDSGLVGYSPHFGFYFGTTRLDFNNTPRSISYDTTVRMNFDFTNTSYCDDNGNLLFYTNGIYIANSLHEKIENSDSMNAGYFQYNWAPAVQRFGYRCPQGVFCIPDVSHSDLYYVIHSWMDTFMNSGNLLCRKTLYTLLDLSQNGGHGRVLSKNNTLVYDTLGLELAITKHGNGRDWWILTPKRNSSCYFRSKLTENGILPFGFAGCDGPVSPMDNIGATCFSPDGNKFAQVTYHSGVTIYDFDRCSGELSNPINYSIPNPGWLGMGVAISPNNRFLYVSYTAYLFQFDLQAQDVPGSIDTVGIYDGTDAPYAAVFQTQQLGPDGKIYISCGNADTVYHVIERPDEKGDSCMFKQHSIYLPSPSAGVPSFPNYRLGALSGSPCDTLTGLNEVARAEKEKLLKVFPNPATNFITVDYGFTDWNKGEVSLEITNELGQLVHQQPLPMYSGFQKIEVQNFAPGMYTAFIKRKGQVVGTAKFARQ